MVLDNSLRFMKAAIVKFKFKSALLAAKACLTANMAKRKSPGVKLLACI